MSLQLVCAQSKAASKCVESSGVMQFLFHQTAFDHCPRAIARILNDVLWLTARNYRDFPPYPLLFSVLQLSARVSKKPSHERICIASRVLSRTQMVRLLHRTSHCVVAGLRQGATVHDRSWCIIGAYASEVVEQVPWRYRQLHWEAGLPWTSSPPCPSKTRRPRTSPSPPPWPMSWA